MKTWWLPALCGVLDAIIAALYFSHVGNGIHSMRDLDLLGKFTVAAGIAAMAAAIWSAGRGKSWLLLLNGLACATLGLIFVFWRGPLAFRTVALFIVIMAISLGIYAFATALTLRRHRAEERLLGLAGAVSLGFAVAFSAFVFRWIKLPPGPPVRDLLWVGSYFAFSAICMWGLALRWHRTPVSESGQREDLPPLANPKHAH